MGEVIYSINGKYFKDYNVLISSSDGIGDGLKRKKVNTYDWPEYHGESPDLSNPKFEAREITLKGFVIGSNWDEMMENFNTILYEFQKTGTQRLLIEPFNMKTRPYEVYMEDSTPLNKTFKDGQMVGVFTLKLIEPNPIKKVLYLTDKTLNLSYNSPKETEIFFVNGEKTTAKGNVSLSGKTLANRVLSGYAFGGRNLFIDGSFLTDFNFINEKTENTNADFRNTDIDDVENIFGHKFLNILSTSAGDRYAWLSQFINAEKSTYYTISFFQKGAGGITGNSSYIKLSDGTFIPIIYDIDKQKKLTHFSFTFKTNSVTNAFRIRFGFQSNAGAWTSITSLKIEKGSKATEFSPAPEEQKIIVIAGNVEEITGLTTNADVLWEKL